MSAAFNTARRRDGGNGNPENSPDTVARVLPRFFPYRTSGTVATFVVLFFRPRGTDATGTRHGARSSFPRITLSNNIRTLTLAGTRNPSTFRRAIFYPPRTMRGTPLTESMYQHGSPLKTPSAERLLSADEKRRWYARSDIKVKCLYSSKSHAKRRWQTRRD